MFESVVPDRSRAQPPRPIPYGLVSLRDIMFNFSPAFAHDMLTIFATHERSARERALLAHRTGSIAHPLAWADEQSKEEVAGLLSTFAIATNALDCSQLRELIRDLGDALKHKMLWSDFGAKVGALAKAAQHELREHHFYHYPRDRGAKVESFGKDWADIWPTCKPAHDEALAAVDCYALDHATASVFHSMRVAEHGLRALARERKIKMVRNRPIEWATWMDILKALEAERKTIEGKPAGPKKDADLAFYGGAISDLNAFKDEYRNMVMHVRATYDHLQALRALERVREFMRRVSAHMDENGKRIKK